MKYEIHFAVELPFWMALPSEQFTVVLDDAIHRLKTSNEVVRIDVGDFYRRPEGYLVKWVHERDRQSSTEELEAAYPNLPVSQRKARTIITHVRETSAPDDSALQDIYANKTEQWVEESIAVVNAFIDWYRFIASTLERKQAAANVSKWDLVSAIVSFWDVSSGSRQVGGTIQPLTQAVSVPPSPISEAELRAFRDRLMSGKQPAAIDALLYGAASLISRGAYRNVVVDAVTALELAVEEAIRKFGQKNRLPAGILDHLARKGQFDEQCKKVIPALGGPKLASQDQRLWKRVRDARKKRHAIVHRGDSATKIEALGALRACTSAALKLINNT
jgi:hypothetical protein